MLFEEYLLTAAAESKFLYIFPSLLIVPILRKTD